MNDILNIEAKITDINKTFQVKILSPFLLETSFSNK